MEAWHFHQEMTRFGALGWETEREEKGFPKCNKGAESTWQEIKSHWMHLFNFLFIFFLTLISGGPEIQDCKCHILCLHYLFTCPYQI